MKKIALTVLNVAPKDLNSHSYAVILKEVNGNRRIPIIIGFNEAHAIAVPLEQIQPKRPLTHDLLAGLLTVFKANLLEVLIYKFEEGVFYAQLICDFQGLRYEIDCRTSDAIAVALRMNCPIYAYDKIVDASAIDMEESEESVEGLIPLEEENKSLEDESEGRIFSALTLEELELLLIEVLEQEDYTQAIKIRDEIAKRNQKE